MMMNTQQNLGTQEYISVNSDNMEGIMSLKGASLVAQTLKNPPTMQETWVQSMGWEDALEIGMATNSTPVFWPGEFHGQRSLAGYSPWSHKELDTTERLSLTPSLPVTLIFRTFPLDDLIQFCDFSHHHADVDGFQIDTRPVQTFLSPTPYGSLLISTSKSHNLTLFIRKY